MTDLMARIERALEPVPIWNEHAAPDRAEERANALRAVLRICDDFELASQYASLTTDIRNAVATELGVIDD